VTNKTVIEFDVPYALKIIWCSVVNVQQQHCFFCVLLLANIECKLRRFVKRFVIEYRTLLCMDTSLNLTYDQKSWIPLLEAEY